MTDSSSSRGGSCSGGTKTPADYDTGCQITSVTVSYDNRYSGLQAVNCQQAIDEINDRATGLSDHTQLDNRGVANSHPQSAITDLETDQAAQDAAIGQNTTDIATNTANIATNTANINTNAIDIDANTDAILINAADISTNSGNIATNTTNIANNAAAIAALEGVQGDYLLKAGGTMTGVLVLNADAVNPLEAVTKQQLDAAGGGTNPPIVTIYDTAGTTTHNFDPATKWAKIIVTGSGGGASGLSTAAHSGAAGGTAIKIIPVTAASATIVVGTAKLTTAGDSSSYADGTYTISATGGAVGAGGALGGIGSGGDINIKGGGSAYDHGNAELGGASYWGGGLSSDDVGQNGAYGSGAGSRRNYGRSFSGGGVVYIEEYQ